MTEFYWYYHRILGLKVEIVFSQFRGDLNGCELVLLIKISSYRMRRVCRPREHTRFFVLNMNQQFMNSFSHKIPGLNFCSFISVWFKIEYDHVNLLKVISQQIVNLRSMVECIFSILIQYWIQKKGEWYF